jgi:hypothetical protein
MAPREMNLMYVPNSGFHGPKVEGILPHFFVLHWMMRWTLAPKIGDSDAISAYEQNLLDAFMKHERFDVFDYIVDEIWNIAINPQRSCGFAPYIMCMIEVVEHERFYKDVAHEQLHPAVPMDPRSHRTSSHPPAVAPSYTTHSDGSSSNSNSGFLKIFRSIFTICHHTDQHIDVMEQCLEIVCHNQEIIHSQRDEPLLEFPDVPVYPPVPNPYASLTPAKLAAFGLCPSSAHVGYDDDDEEANEDEETEEDE